jgi:hypothetical protein
MKESLTLVHCRQLHLPQLHRVKNNLPATKDVEVSFVVVVLLSCELKSCATVASKMKVQVWVKNSESKNNFKW